MNLLRCFALIVLMALTSATTFCQRLYYPVQLTAGRDVFENRGGRFIQASFSGGVGFALNKSFRTQASVAISQIYAHFDQPADDTNSFFPPYRYLPYPVYLGPELAVVYNRPGNGKAQFYSMLGLGWQKSIHKREFYETYLSSDDNTYWSTYGIYPKSCLSQFLEVGVHFRKPTLFNNIGLRYTNTGSIYRGGYRDDKNGPTTTFGLRGFMNLTFTHTFGDGFNFGSDKRELRKR